MWVGPEQAHCFVLSRALLSRLLTVSGVDDSLVRCSNALCLITA